MITLSMSFKDCLKNISVLNAKVLSSFFFFHILMYEAITILEKILVVQSSAVKPGTHVHHPSVCRQVSDIQ